MAKASRERVDIRSIPAYGVAEAAGYLDIPAANLRAWFLGRVSGSGCSARSIPPLLRPASPAPLRLSFVNLVEAHVLDALRRQRRVSLDSVRFLHEEYGGAHPLADLELSTLSRSLVVEREAPAQQLIDATGRGQLLFDMMRPYLLRISRDERGLARKLFPLRRSWSPGAVPFTVVIDPRVSFGRPVIDGTRIPTAVIAGLLKAGEKVEDLAAGYALSPETIREAVAWEERKKAA